MTHSIHPGIDIAAQDHFRFLNGARIGIVCNQASVNSAGKHLVDLVAKQASGELKRIFAPEHGFQGAAQDMIAVSDETHDDLEIDIASLYGSDRESLKPSVEQLSGLDVLLIDLPDIGTRYYTFSQTMAYCMEAAGRTGVKVVVLDRPNPIGGLLIEGSHLTKSCRSFCGIGPIANRHGMTLGELAILFQRGFGEGEDAIAPHPCELDVIGVEGWNRRMYFDETGLPWLRPSPNMPGLDAAIVYPGTCLFEATNLSEGRGTDEPFLQLGAPFVNATDWLKALAEVGLPVEGVSLNPTTFTPQFQKHTGELCHGIRISVGDRTSFQSYRLGIALLLAAAEAFPDDFQWREAPYEFISEVPAIDLLYGNATLREVVEQRTTVNQLLQEMDPFEAWYRTAREPFILY